MIRVFIVDDHTMVRFGVERILSQADDIVVVGSAGSGDRALAELVTLAPDVVLMDIAMPGLSGIETTREITRSGLEAKVIVLSTYDDPENVDAALRAGAAGYLLKDTDPDALVAAIRAVTTGGVPLSPAVAATVVQRAAAPQEPAVILSKREADVVLLIADGYSNKQIGRLLGISDKTVKTHTARLFRRLGVHDRTQAAIWAERHLKGSVR